MPGKAKSDRMPALSTWIRAVNGEYCLRWPQMKGELDQLDVRVIDRRDWDDIQRELKAFRKAKKEAGDVE